MSSLLEIKGLTKTFPLASGMFSPKVELKALRSVDLTIARGETLGLVGESGCGKSTLGRCILKLIEPTSGSILFDNKDLVPLSSSQMKPLRRRIQIIFQDPYSSLNPRMTVGSILEEPLIIHQLFKGSADRRKRVMELLSTVGLKEEAYYRYPHEFSGGQRQRVGIARALAVEPEFIVCDEPVSALDVSIQAQIINLLMDLQKKLNLTYLFISHDLRVVEYISHHVAVMYLGRVVESASRRELYANPKHPYTQALLSAVPHIDRDRSQKRIVLGGEPPRPTDPPPGCSFHPRCSIAVPECSQRIPELKKMKQGETHFAACLLAE